MKNGTGKRGQSPHELINTSRQTVDTVRAKTTAFQESEERFRAIFDSVNDAIFIHDLETGAVLDVNQRMCEMFGFTREEALRLRATDSSAGEPPYTEEDALNWIRKAATGEPQIFEWHAKHKTGRLFWVEVNMRRAAIGAEERLLASVRDITDRKKAEANLQEYEKAVEGSQDMIATVDRDYRYRLANAAFLGYRGMSKEEVIGRSVAEILGKKFFERTVKESLDRCFRGQTVHYETRRTYAGLGRRHLLVSYFPISGPAGVDRVTAVIRDMTEQRHAEAALRESEEKYRNIFDNGVMGIFQSTPEGRYIRANAALARTYGYDSPEEMIKSVTDIGAQQYVNPEGRVKLKKECAAHGFVAGFETQMFRKDGTIIWVSLNVRAVRDAEGTILYYEGTQNDITSRKQTEQELKISRARLSKAELISRSGNWEFDLESNQVFGSEGAREVYGLLGSEWMIPEVQKIPLPEYRDMLDRAIRGLIRESRLYDVEFKIRRPDNGEIIDIHSVAEYDRGRKVVFGIIQDITKQKRAEETLREREAEYRKLFESAPVGIFHSTPEGRFLKANPSLASMLCYSSPEEMVSSISDIGEQIYVDSKVRNDIFSNTLKTQSWVFAENRYRRKDGGILIGNLAVRKELDPDGTIRYLEGFVEDITARRLAEEEKELLESQLRQSQKMEAIGTLAGGVAHDFNNILMAIIGFASVLQMDLEKGDPKSSYVNQILASAERAANLIRSLLAFSRKQQISPKPQRINDIIGQTTELLKRLLPENVELKVALADLNPVILADATQIDQILINLATNARDAMPKGGTLSIKTGIARLDEALSALHGYGKPGDYALVSLSDNGTGMDKKTKEHIFEPFFTTKEVGKGTGLGLSSVYGIVKQHNGFLTVDSVPKKGTTVQIYFPLAGGKEEGPSREPGQAQRGSETVLVAEDDPAVRMLIADILGRYGYATIEATDGQDAVRKFIYGKNHIDLIIIDVVMPKMGGKEAYEEITRTNSNVRVLFTSGYTRDTVIDKGVEDGTIDFIEKPIMPQELLRKVRAVLDR